MQQLICGNQINQEGLEMNDKFLTVSAAAQALKIPESTLRSLERRGELVAIRDSAGRRLFKLKDIENFAQQRRTITLGRTL